MSINKQGPQFHGKTAEDLRAWAVIERLPWLVRTLGLVAGVICGSIDAVIRRMVYGLGSTDELPDPINWERNGIVISPPGTGKGMAIFVEALLHFERVFVLVPSVIQAHKLEASLDTLYHRKVAGAKTSQRKSGGLIQVITTGIFHQLVRDKSSDLWKAGTCLIVDEAQRVLEEDPETEFMLGYASQQGVPTFIVSATIAPGTLPKVFGHGDEKPALVYELAKEMHPVDIHVRYGDKPDEILTKLPALQEKGRTALVFCGSRREVMRVVKTIRKAEDVPAWAIGVTGAHVVEEQLDQIARAQKTDKPVVVVATPGTMDSSVTIPGLDTVIILDERFRVDWNRYGVVERWVERLPINHIWQMVRRVGRIARMDGKRDEVYIISSANRTDVQTDHPTFEALSGCSPNTPIENLLLEAVSLDVPFRGVHEYMLSTFSDAHIEGAIQRLLDHGMIERVDDPTDPDGFQITDKGALVVSLPYDYVWSRLIVETPRDLQLWLTMAASCGEIRDLEMFEEEELKVQGHELSEVIRKVVLGVQYLRVGHDDAQAEEAWNRGLSFRRLEQAETLFTLGCEVLGIEWSPTSLTTPSPEEMMRLVDELVLGGLRTGLSELYLIAEGNRGGWNEPRPTPDTDGRPRRFFADEDSGLAYKEMAEGGVCAVVGTPTWFTSRGGSPCANLDNVTIVPRHLVKQLVEERAKKEGWMQLTFKMEDNRGRPELRAYGSDGYTKYLPSRSDNQPDEGRAYWCSMDRRLAYGVHTVWVHYPVVE